MRERKKKLIQLSLGWAAYWQYQLLHYQSLPWLMFGFFIYAALFYMLIDTLLFDTLDEFGLWDSFVTIATFKKIKLN